MKKIFTNGNFIHLFSAIIIIILLTIPAFSQSIVQTQPGIFYAGIPTDEFEYFAAPEGEGKQRQSNWCWAACIQMVLNYHHIRVSQEEIVARCFGELIDTPANAPVIIQALSGWGITTDGKKAVISASTFVYSGSDIVRDLAFKQPLIVGLKTDNALGHACVLTAVSYSVNPYNNEPIFRSAVIRDPSPMSQSRIELPWDIFYSRLMFLTRIRVMPVN